MTETTIETCLFCSNRVFRKVIIEHVLVNLCEQHHTDLIDPRKGLRHKRIKKLLAKHLAKLFIQLDKESKWRH